MGRSRNRRGLARCSTQILLLKQGFASKRLLAEQSLAAYTSLEIAHNGVMPIQPLTLFEGEVVITLCLQ